MRSVTANRQLLHAWRQCLTAYARMLGVLGAELEAEFDLPLPWYEVLLLLSEAPDRQRRMHELAESRLLSRSAATRLIDRMETAGLVTRSQCSEDRRGTNVALTDAGAQLFRDAGRLHLAGIQRLFMNNVDLGEAEVLSVVFGRILDRLDGETV